MIIMMMIMMGDSVLMWITMMMNIHDVDDDYDGWYVFMCITMMMNIHDYDDGEYEWW